MRRVYTALRGVRLCDESALADIVCKRIETSGVKFPKLAYGLALFCCRQCLERAELMSHDSTFDYSLDSEFDEFDPLEDNSSEEDEDEGSQDAAIASATASAPAAPQAKEDTRTPSERTADLLKAMAPRRKVLLGILKFCKEPQVVAEVNTHVDKLQEDNYSVYTAANLCNLLEGAGALERTTPEGEPYVEEEKEPRVVVDEDGNEYLQAAEPDIVCWKTTEAGQEALDADKPLERLRTLLQDDEKYATIYKRILTMCAEGSGCGIPAINSAVDNDPLVQKPRLYAPHFVDKLEKCDALEWHKTWQTTEIGKEGLKQLAEVEDTYAAEQAALKEAQATEEAAADAAVADDAADAADDAAVVDDTADAADAADVTDAVAAAEPTADATATADAAATAEPATAAKPAPAANEKEN